MDRLLVICGPTATGKTSLAVKLAKKFNGELISADSRQLYQGMDIGTGKDQPKGIKIHLIDVVKPNQEFSVSQYYRLAWQAIKKIWKKGKLPILVGGTGLYIKAVVNGIGTMEIPPNPQLRKSLEGKKADELFGELGKLDPIRAAKMNVSDKKNLRRLIRAIEISRWQAENESWAPLEHKRPETLLIGLKASYDFLYQRIDQRVKERVKMGQEKEIKNLLKKGYSWENSVLGTTLGYQEWQLFFEGKTDREEVIKRWQFAEHAYARRQMTWFKKALRQAQGKDKQINWFDISEKRWQDRVVKLVKGWLAKKNAQKS